MGFLKRLAFYAGLILGLAVIAAAGATALTYLLTGKLVSLDLAQGKPTVTLITPDEIVALFRSQLAQEEQPSTAEERGNGNG